MVLGLVLGMVLGIDLGVVLGMVGKLSVFRDGDCGAGVASRNELSSLKLDSSRSNSL